MLVHEYQRAVASLNLNPRSESTVAADELLPRPRDWKEKRLVFFSKEPRIYRSGRFEDVVFISKISSNSFTMAPFYQLLLYHET